MDMAVVRGDPYKAPWIKASTWGMGWTYEPGPGGTPRPQDRTQMLGHTPETKKSCRGSGLIRNPGLTMGDLKAKNPGSQGKWCWKTLSGHQGITMADVLANKSNPWNWDELSKKVGLKFADVLANPDKQWD